VPAVLRRTALSRLGFALLALGAALLCVRLGFWQWQRGSLREAQAQRFALGATRLVTLGDAAASTLALYQHVSVQGRFDGAHQFLLDNRSFAGRAGYEVLTPLRRPPAATLLVDRGWVPFSGARRVLPDVHLDSTATVTLTGVLADLPSAGLALGRAAPAGEWPKVTSFPDLSELEAALGEPLERRILWLDPGAPSGYARDWHAPGMSPLRHFSYAIQWWCFAGLALLIWAVMTLRGLKRRPA
jgi:surfeit locus 1 family protein